MIKVQPYLSRSYSPSRNQFDQLGNVRSIVGVIVTTYQYRFVHQIWLRKKYHARPWDQFLSILQIVFRPEESRWLASTREVHLLASIWLLARCWCIRRCAQDYRNDQRIIYRTEIKKLYLLPEIKQWDDVKYVVLEWTYLELQSHWNCESTKGSCYWTRLIMRVISETKINWENSTNWPCSTRSQR
jgi:hypothetical protein